MKGEASVGGNGKEGEGGRKHWRINSTHEAGRMTAETQLFLRTVLADMLAPEALA